MDWIIVFYVHFRNVTDCTLTLAHRPSSVKFRFAILYISIIFFNFNEVSHVEKLRL